jgi:hypothetical protein
MVKALQFGLAEGGLMRKQCTDGLLARDPVAAPRPGRGAPSNSPHFSELDG